MKLFLTIFSQGGFYLFLIKAISRVEIEGGETLVITILLCLNYFCLNIAFFIIQVLNHTLVQLCANPIINE